MENLAHCIDRVHSGRSRVFQSLKRARHVPAKRLKISAAERAHSLGEAVGRGCADRSRAAYNHIAYGDSRCLVVSCLDELKAVRQEPLINQHDTVGTSVEADGAVMSGASMKSHVHLRDEDTSAKS